MLHANYILVCWRTITLRQTDDDFNNVKCFENVWVDAVVMDHEFIFSDNQDEAFP